MIDQNAISRGVSGLAAAVACSAIGGGSMVHRLDFDLGFIDWWRQFQGLI